MIRERDAFIHFIRDAMAMGNAIICCRVLNSDPSRSDW